MGDLCKVDFIFELEVCPVERDGVSACRIGLFRPDIGKTSFPVADGDGEFDFFGGRKFDFDFLESGQVQRFLVVIGGKRGISDFLFRFRECRVQGVPVEFDGCVFWKIPFPFQIKVLSIQNQSGSPASESVRNMICFSCVLFYVFLTD